MLLLSHQIAQLEENINSSLAVKLPKEILFVTTEIHTFTESFWYFKLAIIPINLIVKKNYSKRPNQDQSKEITCILNIVRSTLGAK